jgi:autotransporter strand-loop-strand O-heptosyltransferase
MITSEPLNDEWHDSKLGGTLKNVVNKTGNLPLEDRMNDIVHASAFIGVGSGLSWLSWALGQKTVLISGFSEPYSEFTDCERIYTPSGNCSGCFNREWLNPGDWEWCPEHKDTPRHFECTKSITPEMVIKSLQKVLNIY